MKRLISLLKLYPIPVIFSILAGGFFLSYAAFKVAGGNALDYEYFGTPSLFALSIALLTFATARQYYVWSRKPGKNGETDLSE